MLNLVYTGNLEDVYHTTVYEVNSIAYMAVMEREMGKQTARKWQYGRLFAPNNYRPIQLDSEFGVTNIFTIPYHGRQRVQAHSKAKYVKTVREGIKESYQDMPTQKEVNLQALRRAVEESKII